ncbi:ArsR family transcriptional regulator [Keratinibaculum paraultunense]|uniref:ArsR family transcriptional regulator n=1 Tax=Keratinibaculum paraultunense TaxID=1278232 RepID=A0A4R3KVN7_9FIRM|nr:metalloregulator ArsR/SmtB family transcription factor [Keratinibaculum paraultunense]TCS88776.1 ArsR family transcriptional regulator [Keratinibaculum paraultunense]
MNNNMEEKEICEVSATDESTLKNIKESMYDEETINRLAQTFKALADPTRLKIIYVLSKQPLCVCDIANLLDMTQSAISHHLRLLRNLRLVKFKKEGKMVIYSLDDDHVLQLFKQGMDHVRHD